MQATPQRPSDRVVMQGWLWKRRDYLPGYRKRWVVVQNGKLNIYASSVSPLDCPKATFQLKGCFAATEGLGQSWDGQPTFLFRVSFPFQGRQFFMGATTDEERTRWLSSIQGAILKNHFVSSAAGLPTRRQSSPTVMMSPAGPDKNAGPYYTSVLLEEASILCRSRTVTPETEVEAVPSNAVSPSDLSQADTDGLGASAGTSPDADSCNLQPLTLFFAPGLGGSKSTASQERASHHEDDGHVAWNIERCASAARTEIEAGEDRRGVGSGHAPPPRSQGEEEEFEEGVLGDSMLSIDLATPDRSRVCDEAAQVSCRASPAVLGNAAPRYDDRARLRACAVMAFAAMFLAAAALRRPLAHRLYRYVRERIGRLASFLLVHPRLAERAQDLVRGACVDVLLALRAVSQRGGRGAVGAGLVASRLYGGALAGGGAVAHRQMSY